MTYAIFFALLFVAYRIRSKYRNDRHLIDATTAAYLRGRGDRADAFDAGYMERVSDEKKLGIEL